MERLQLTTLAAQNITSSLLVDTYTATADMELLVNLYLSGLGGSGSYRVSLTKQLGGAGTAYQTGTVAIAVSAGTTTAYLPTTSIPVRTGDVVKTYAQGLAGDVAVGVKIETFDVTAATPGSVSGLATTIGVAGAGLTAVPWSAAWDAEVQSEVTDALNLYDPPTEAEMDAALLVLRGADSDTLETLSDQLDGIPAGVWDVALPGGYLVGEAGYILGNLQNLNITLASPVVDDDTVELHEGDSYYEADGRSLKWTDSGTTWPNITGASVALLVRAPTGDKLSAAGVVSIGGGGAGQQVYVELSAAQTTAMVDWPKPSHFRLRVTLVGGHVVTLAAGTMTVHYDIA